MAILPGAAVLDLLISAANLIMHDGSASRQLMLSSASFVAPMPLEDSAQQLARCSLDLAAGTARLSRPHSESSSAQRYATASIQRHKGATQLRAAPVERPQAGAAAHAVHTQHAARPVSGHRLAQAVPDISPNGTTVQVAPLDCSLQLSAVRSHGPHDSSRSHSMMVPSGLQACIAPTSAKLPDAASCPLCWASTAADSARDSSSHRLAAAGDETLGPMTLEGVQFKPMKFKSCATSNAHPTGLPLDNMPGILYELCPLVVSPASSAAAETGPSVQPVLQLRSHRPASAASAALVALQTLGGSAVACGTAGRPATLLEGGDQDVEALLQTARLEQPSLGACLTGIMVT